MKLSVQSVLILKSVPIAGVVSMLHLRTSYTYFFVNLHLQNLKKNCKFFSEMFLHAQYTHPSTVRKAMQASGVI